MKEAQNTEWRRSWRDEYLRWICGFANAEGGTLAIGKNDSGDVAGVANAARLLEDIPNKVRDIPGIVVSVKSSATPAVIEPVAATSKTHDSTSTLLSIWNNSCGTPGLIKSIDG